MNKETLEKAAVGFAVVTLISLAWFWSVQVGWVIETLEMAYGWYARLSDRPTATSVYTAY